MVSITPPTIAFYLPAMFMGIVLPGILMEKYFLKRWGEKYLRFKITANQIWKVNLDKFGRFLCIAGASLSLFAVGYFLWVTPYIQNGKIHVRWYGMLTERVYSALDVKKVIRSQSFIAPNGRRRQATNYHIIFKDDWRWDLPDGELEQTFVEEVSKISGMTIVDEEIE